MRHTTTRSVIARYAAVIATGAALAGVPGELAAQRIRSITGSVGDTTRLAAKRDAWADLLSLQRRIEELGITRS